MLTKLAWCKALSGDPAQRFAGLKTYFLRVWAAAVDKLLGSASNSYLFTISSIIV